MIRNAILLVLRFTVNAPGCFSVEFDGEHHALHLFVEPARDFLNKAATANLTVL